MHTIINMSRISTIDNDDESIKSNQKAVPYSINHQSNEKALSSINHQSNEKALSSINHQSNEKAQSSINHQSLINHQSNQKAVPYSDKYTELVEAVYTAVRFRIVFTFQRIPNLKPKHILQLIDIFFKRIPDLNQNTHCSFRMDQIILMSFLNLEF